MNIDSVYNSLKSMVLGIQDYETFVNFVKKNNNSYEEVITKIKKAKELKDKKVNYSDFEKHLVDYFKEIQSIINKDSLCNFSNEEDISKFKSFFQSIADKYIIIYKVKDDKDECKKIHDEIDNLKSEIDKYNSSSLTPDILSKINDLKFNLDLKSMEYRRLLSSIEESTKLMTKYSNKTEFIYLINVISKDLDILSNLMNNLSLTNVSIVGIRKVLESITYYFETVEVECINDINRYNDICIKAGLVKPNIVNNTKKENEEIDNSVDNSVNAKETEDIPLDINSNIENDDYLSIDYINNSLNIGDYVVYNGTNSYTDYDNSDLLTTGAVYRVNRVDFDNKGNEIIYLDGSDVPYSVTLFDLAANYTNDFSNLVSSIEPGNLKYNLKDIYRMALKNLSTKKITEFVKNMLSNPDNEAKKDTHNDLLNLDEFSKIYEEAKGKAI